MPRMNRVLHSGVLLAFAAMAPTWAHAATRAFDANQATCQYYLLSAKNAWSRPGGDWFDRTGEMFGPQPFASSTVVVRPGRQSIRWNITTLAIKWQEGDGVSGAVYLKTSDRGRSGVVNFESVEAAEWGARPVLEVEWDDGHAMRLAPGSDTFFSCPTYTALGKQPVLKVSTGESALLVFPFTARSGHRIRSAALILETDRQYAPASDIGVFGLRLPSHGDSMKIASAAKEGTSRVKSALGEREVFPPVPRPAPPTAPPPAPSSSVPSAPPPAVAIGDPDADWLARSHAPGVVIAVGFDDIHDWAKYNWDRSDCNPAYEVLVDGKKTGCRSNAWDQNVHASGKGSIRFDILSQSSQGGGGNIVIPFGDYAKNQFGAGSDMWVSWRQRMDVRFIQGYRAQGGGYANAKQVIIAQGDVPNGKGGTVTAKACSEAELVIVGSSPSNPPTYPIGYIECGRYAALEQVLRPGQYAGDAKGSTIITRQNMRANAAGQSDCIGFPAGRDQSGCFNYVANEWTTYMVHLKIGPDGGAVSSVSGKVQPGYIDSTYELYAAHPGQDFQLLHHQTGVVIPKGQYYVGGDPLQASSYKSGWGPGDGHPQAKYGKLWLLPYMTGKDPKEVTTKASTWYDDVIVSRCRIAAPGFPTPKDCTPPDDVHSPLAAAVTPTAPGATPPAGDSPVAPTATVIGVSGLPAPSQIPVPGSSFPNIAASGMSGTQMMAALHGLTPGHWLEIPDSQMVRVQVNACKSAVIQSAYDRIGNGVIGCSPDSVMSYSGGAYDSRGHRLLVWGGGHAGYAGNEIYAFDIVGGEWQRLTEPTPPILDVYYDKATKKYSPVSPPWRNPTYPPTPVSVHSYDQLDYLPDQNLLFAAGGSTFSGNGFATQNTWLFDLSKHDASGWSEAQPMPGKPYGLYEYNMDTAYDPVSGKVLMRGYSQAGAFDPATRTWAITNTQLSTRKLATVAALDPKRRLFVVIGAETPGRGAAEVYPVDASGALGSPHPLGATGDTAIEQAYAPGFEYDAAADRLVAWGGGGDVYTLDLDRRVWTKHAAIGSVVPGDPANTPYIRGTYGRFRYMPEYDAFIVVNGNRQNVFLYRLSR